MAYGNALTELFSHHVAAVQLIAPGEQRGDVRIRSTTPMTAMGFMQLKDDVRANGQTVVSLMFDVNGEVPQLTGVWIMMPSTDPVVLARGEDLTLLVDCKLWAPVGDGRFAIVAPKAFGGHFVVTDDMRLEHRSGLPARDLTAGIKRATTRIARLARSGTALVPGDTTVLFAA